MLIYTVKDDLSCDDLYRNGVHICPGCLAHIAKDDDGKMMSCSVCCMWVCPMCVGLTTETSLYCRSCYTWD